MIEIVDMKEMQIESAIASVESYTSCLKDLYEKVYRKYLSDPHNEPKPDILTCYAAIDVLKYKFESELKGDM